VCDQTKLITTIYDQVLAGKEPCGPVFSAFQSGKIPDVHTLCKCLDVIDQSELDHFKCKFLESDVYPVHRLNEDMCPCKFFNDFII
tara:strand:+ start:61 stop:318 length:258 start_codon:yes stop_codon:yes gene_type:complete